MLSVTDSVTYLKNKLLTRQDINVVWEIFKDFGRMSIEGEDEIALIFECGVSDFSGEDEFYFTFSRQFSIYEDKNYLGMAQLHLQYKFPIIDNIKRLKTEISYFEGEGDVNNFYNEVEISNEFRTLLNFKPSNFDIYLEEI